MYIRCKCVNCNTVGYHDVKIEAIESTEFRNFESASSYVIKNIIVSDSVGEEELVKKVLKGIKNHLHNGISIKELCQIIHECYGVALQYCYDLIKRIKIEAGMYCPDGEHLYYT